MAVTAASLAAVLGITVADSDDANDPGLVEGARLLALADALVTAYLRGGTAPEAVRDEAVIRTAGHCKNRSGYGKADGPLAVGDLKLNVNTAASPIRQSGAAAILTHFVKRGA